MNAFPRVRFAPSPTGFLHVGGARTALFNWLFARRTGGSFVLRIEDTDRDRSSAEMTRAIVEGMTWLGLDWDEGPVHQADGLDRHRADALRLIGANAAYRCFCTPEQLQQERAAAEARGEAYRYDRRCANIGAEESEQRGATEPFTVRFRVPPGSTTWNDLVHGPTEWPHAEIDDFIVLRSDRTPVYNLAVVSDDVEMSITHVIRGDDHIANTPRQILLYGALGAELPKFAHLPMILGPDGKRLSKRHGATAVGEYAQQGILPDALVNFLALLGWNPGDDVEVMEIDEMVARFGLERVNKKSAVFDPVKLEWMNHQHLMRMPPERIAEQIRPALEAHGFQADEQRLHALIEMLKPRAKTVAEIGEKAGLYFSPEVELDPDAVAKHWRNAAEADERLAAAAHALEQLHEWSPAAIDAALRAAAEQLGIGFGKLVHPLRVALTGGAASPGIDSVVQVIGRDGVQTRIRQARERIAQAAH